MARTVGLILEDTKPEAVGNTAPAEIPEESNEATEENEVTEEQAEQVAPLEGADAEKKGRKK